MLAGTTTGAASAAAGASKRANAHKVEKGIDNRRRRLSVLNSTRNLMASLRRERKPKGNVGHVVSDPIEQFLRRIDTSNMMSNSADGFELDDEDGYVPQALQCQLKGKTCIFLPSAPGRLVWDVMIAIMILYYLFMVRGANLFTGALRS